MSQGLPLGDQRLANTESPLPDVLRVPHRWSGPCPASGQATEAERLSEEKGCLETTGDLLLYADGEPVGEGKCDVGGRKEK